MIINHLALFFLCQSCPWLVTEERLHPSLEILGRATKLSALSKCNALKSSAQIWRGENKKQKTDACLKKKWKTTSAMAVSATGRISKMQCLKAGLSRSFLWGLILPDSSEWVTALGLATREREHLHLWSSRCCRFTTFALSQWNEGKSVGGQGVRYACRQPNLDWIKKARQHFQRLKIKRSKRNGAQAGWEKCSGSVCVCELGDTHTQTHWSCVIWWEADELLVRNMKVIPDGKKESQNDNKVIFWFRSSLDWYVMSSNLFWRQISTFCVSFSLV